jgi:hypothetical protein
MLKYDPLAAARAVLEEVFFPAQAPDSPQLLERLAQHVRSHCSDPAPLVAWAERAKALLTTFREHLAAEQHTQNVMGVDDEGYTTDLLVAVDDALAAGPEETPTPQPGG